MNQRTERVMWLGLILLLSLAFNFYIKALVPVYEKSAALDRQIQEQKLESIVASQKVLDSRISRLEMLLGQE